VIVSLEAYVVTVHWHGEDRDVLALSAGAMPLIGMSLLWGSRVAFDAQDGGLATIDLIQ